MRKHLKALRDRRRPSLPVWPLHRKGMRVLVEHSDPAVRDILARKLTDRGYEVLTCMGPNPQPCDGPLGPPCPLLRQERCPAVNQAEAVICGLDFRNDLNRLVARRHARYHPTRPLLIEGLRGVEDDNFAESIGASSVFRLGMKSVTSFLSEATLPKTTSAAPNRGGNLRSATAPVPSDTIATTGGSTCDPSVPPQQP